MIDKGEYIPKVIFINGKHQPSASAPSYKIRHYKYNEKGVYGL